MPFFLHAVEKLYPCRDHGLHGDISPAFFDTKAVSVDIIHRDRLGAHTFQCEILQGVSATLGPREKRIIPPGLSFDPAAALLRAMNMPDIPHSKRLASGPNADAILG